MAAPGPPPGAQPFSRQQIEQMIAMEAQKRGMTIPQFQAFQRQQIEAEAAKAGISPQQFIQMKQEEAKQQFMRQQQQQQQQQPGQGQQRPPQGQVQQIPVNLNAGVQPTPAALAVAKFLRSQDLKTRTCIFNGERKDMFKGRARIMPVPVLLPRLTYLSKTSLPCPTLRQIQESSEEEPSSTQGRERC